MSDRFDEIDAAARSPHHIHRPAADIYKEDARAIREVNRAAGGLEALFSTVRATWVPMVITDSSEHDNPIVFANGAFAKLTGFQREETLGRNCRFLEGPATSKEDAARLQTALDSRNRVEVSLFNYRKDGTAFWSRLVVSPVIDDRGDQTKFHALQFDLTMEHLYQTSLKRELDNAMEVRARWDVELHADERHLRFAISASGLGSWTLNLFTNEYRACERSKIIYGRPPTEHFTHEQLEAAIHPDDRDRRTKALKLAIALGNDIDIEFRVLTPEGKERWVHVCGQVDYMVDGTALLMSGIVRDITLKRRDDEHRALLADELSHRVKNTLASLQAVVAQTMRHASSIDGAATTLGGRIQAMAAANDLLVNERFESASILDVLTRALGPFGVEEGHRFVLDGNDLQLPPRLVVSFALLLHELATNATKYGALSNAEGVVRISWMVVTASETRRLHLAWIETRGPRVEPPTKTSFGTRLIQRVLEHEVGGTAEISYMPDGISFKAMVPLQALE